MASSATPSTLMLSHGASSLLPQHLTPSLSFKLKPCLFNFSNTFSLYSLVLHFTHRKSNNWIDVSSPNSPVVVAALSAEAELAEETEQLQEGVKGVVESGVVVIPTKPKKGKAALPLKSDRRRSKRFLEIQKLRENEKEYDLKTAISLLKQMASTKFVETAEAHFRLNIDP
ncbi:hypothetical protein HYC85_011223 [Camellia sinensis]|uniref:Uncharacterized protein n=1 Tax=Camellia sinensis TaxID=4442 RepID=A0A7J7HKR0_CAMSI|nr:hypothetical protein HYC85_011223 [Camellia sinensis]